MDEIKIAWEIFQKFGWSGILTVFIFWDKFLRPQWRKRVSGEYVHWKDLKNKLDEDNEKLKRLEKLINSELEKQIEKDLKIQAIEISHHVVQKNVEDLKYFLRDSNANLKTNNRLVGEIKDALLKLQEGRDGTR